MATNCPLASAAIPAGAEGQAEVLCSARAIAQHPDSRVNGTLSVSHWRLMIRPKILAGLGNQLAISWVINRLNAGNLGAQRRHVSADMLHELRLGICRSGNQYSSRVGYGLCHALKKIVILRRVTTAN
jgi:hypothetical protein